MEVPIRDIGVPVEAPRREPATWIYFRGAVDPRGREKPSGEIAGDRTANQHR